MTAARVLAIDFGGTKIAIATAAVGSPDGRPEGTVRLRTLGSAGALQAVRRTLDAARALLTGPAAVGVSTFGVLRGGRVRLAPNVPGWDGMALPELLRAEFGDAPVAIDNDVNAGAAAELRWGALRGVDVGLYVNLGTGLAAALVAGGRVLAGAHGAAGEIGYLRDRDGDPTFADGHAPLEDVVSGAALGRRGSELLGRPVSAAELFELRDEPGVADLLDATVATLARTVANLCVTLDPERVVLAGGMLGAADHIVPRVEAELRRAVPFPPRLVKARFVDDAPLVGAVALALESAA
ncbi:glucokinase [Actinoplanes sp. NBRC 14428]|uniref:Glucokinase n=1 Tax=Pseudosporangium ferrugineum TaxID=439699 RepID=A0A2T0SAL2_9ACTN|nr:ROK family protein [Pseudosporangium ferrugineum]PRY30459.1 glucokinase [Pseudosporangium ferrugineum]BCJ49988.1 glucokinase [Actinoplanes sp. NBRC 14428]